MRKGFYERFFEDDEGAKRLIKIQRVRCSSCRASHCLLYDFLVPYRRYTLKALVKPFEAYVSNENSYLSALDETVKDTALLFEIVRSVLRQMPLIWMQLMKIALEASFDLTDLRKKRICPNGHKARKQEKRDRLDWAAAMLELFPNALETLAKEGFFPFANGRGCALLRTHSSECQLF